MVNSTAEIAPCRSQPKMGLGRLRIAVRWYFTIRCWTLRCTLLFACWINCGTNPFPVLKLYSLSSSVPFPRSPKSDGLTVLDNAKHKYCLVFAWLWLVFLSYFHTFAFICLPRLWCWAHILFIWILKRYHPLWGKISESAFSPLWSRSLFYQ